MDYKAAAAKATRMIKSFGRKGVLVQIPPGAYDASTSKVAQGAPVETSINVVTLDYSSREIDGKNIVAGDVRAYIDAGSAVPAIGNTLKIDGQVWRLIQPKPLNPGGIAIFYELQLRR